MQVHYYKDEELLENRVEVYFNRQDEEIENLRAFLEDDKVLLGSQDKTTKRIFPTEIFYLEIVDRHCFAYLESDVYQLEISLRDFLDKYHTYGFVQIGKSTIVNAKKIDHIVPDINMRMHLILENGEKLVVNRSYKKDFMAHLKGKGEDNENTK